MPVHVYTYTYTAGFIEALQKGIGVRGTAFKNKNWFQEIHQKFRAIMEDKERFTFCTKKNIPIPLNEHQNWLHQQILWFLLISFRLSSSQFYVGPCSYNFCTPNSFNENSCNFLNFFSSFASHDDASLSFINIFFNKNFYDTLMLFVHLGLVVDIKIINLRGHCEVAQFFCRNVWVSDIVLLLNQSCIKSWWWEEGGC